MTTGGEGPINRQPEDVELREDVELVDEAGVVEMAGLHETEDSEGTDLVVEPESSSELSESAEPSEEAIQSENVTPPFITPPEVAQEPEVAVFSTTLSEDAETYEHTASHVVSEVSEVAEPLNRIEHVPTEFTTELAQEAISTAPGLEQFGLEGASLLDGEIIDRALDLGEEGDSSGTVLLLTNRRIIQVYGPPKDRSVTFASVKDIDLVEVTKQTEGNSAYYWAAASFVVAFFLWRVIEHPLGSIGAAIVVALMGVYLIADKLLSAGKSVIVFRVGNREFTAYPTGNGVTAFEFANRVFEIKESATGSTTDRPFAPR